MSLILEALRKSEADRRRGEVPNVHAELSPSPDARRIVIPAWIWWLLAAVIVLIGLWLLRDALTRTPSTPVAPASAHAAAIPASSRQAIALPPVSHLSPVPASTESTSPRPPAAVVVPKPATQPAPDITMPATTRAPGAFVLPPAPPATTTISSSTGFLQLSNLSVEERKALPPLKLSMHMWNDDPTQRFVILDGNRLHEGDRIGDAVVTAITADGVVLDWNGRRLKLPIR